MVSFPLKLPLSRELSKLAYSFCPVYVLICVDISSPCFSRAGIPSLTQNSEAMSSTVGLAAKDIPMNGEEMYLRLLAINSYKNVPPERVLAFENSAS